MVAVALAGLVGYQLWRLRRALRAKVFGSRLTLRLLVLFVAMAVVPGALVYTVSLQFLAKSIESWFDVRVDAALECGLSLGRDALDAMLEELRGKARVMAFELGDMGAGERSLEEAGPEIVEGIRVVTIAFGAVVSIVLILLGSGIIYTGI